MALHVPRPVSASTFALAAFATLAALASPRAAIAAEPAACLNPDPTQWPEPSKPYFMIAVDTSGSMTQNVVPATGNTCAFGSTGTQRIDHARCALRKTVQAFSGQVHFGLTTFNTFMAGCNAGTCYNPPWVFGNPPTGCGARLVPGDQNFGCAIEPDPSQPFSADRRGGNILVPMQAQDYWNSPPQASNVATMLSYVDNDCTNNIELYAGGGTSSNGILRDLFRYFSGSWTSTDGTRTYTTPLGTAAQGERACRSVNIIFMTDGDEDCDTEVVNGKTAAEDAAEKLLAGFTLPGDSIPWSIKTYVIRFAGGTQATTDKIAAAGGTGSSLFASNEVDLSKAFSQIISSVIKPETCDNLDNNCNGCTDEGFKHYCNTNPVCCAWADDAARAACLTTYQGTITAANPQGDLTKLPCATSVQATDPKYWVCVNPADVCDETDNNCDGTVDENQLKCGNPAHCPSAEICDGIDNNCNGAIDEGCPTPCIPSAEVCDGCDNDCDGIADNGIAAIPCGLTGPGEPANCAGVLACKAPQAVPVGGCVAGGGFNACTATSQTEICDGLDNDCDGIIDDNVPSIPCVPNGTQPGLNYGPNSQCKMGQTQCSNGVTLCVGFVGPSSEICDGIDNNCDGTVDNGVMGLGQTCGVATPPCTPGVTACVNGAIVCSGGVQPKPEICDGIDNDCDTLIDEAPLADAPAMGQNACWPSAAPNNCCQFPTVAIPGAPAPLKWCPPPGANCTDVGTLTQPCKAGTLVCGGAQGWQCVGPKTPSGEICDGIDNDCNGTTDDGNFPGEGQPCGTDIGECSPGVNQCVNGVFACVGGVGPSSEVCDGLDNDCNGFIDDGIPLGADCVVPYDTAAYPGDRTHAPCQPGKLQCDGMGNTICIGGVGPQPEVCDGIDNDCDGAVDEAGLAPDGVNGSQNPLPPPSAAIGDMCGVNQGECKSGQYQCVNGLFACVGETAPVPETCDCNDNDCDGQNDNENAPGLPPLCGQGSSCVKSDLGCQCAKPCGSGEFKCPAGQACKDVTSSQTGQSLGAYCVSDPCGADCSVQIGKTPDGTQVLCAPASTPPDQNCQKPPVCVCKGQNGCKNPCFGVTCNPGTVCTEYGANAGTCVADNCYNNPCVGCGKVCNLGVCVDNPCTDVTCQPDEECKPSSDFTTFTCIKPCGDVMCDAGKTCVDGVCVDDCSPPCQNGQVCDRTKVPPACVDNKCNPNPCTDGSFCDPVTGQCGNDPCTGVVCPTGVCKDGQCPGMGSSSSSSSSTSSSSGGGGGGGGEGKGVWGLATGGGGCSCEVGAGVKDVAGGSSLALLGLALMLGRRARRRGDPKVPPNPPGARGSRGGAVSKQRRGEEVAQ